jgi:hypothetical protein
MTSETTTAKIEDPGATGDTKEAHMSTKTTEFEPIGHASIPAFLHLAPVGVGAFGMRVHGLTWIGALNEALARGWRPAGTARLVTGITTRGADGVISTTFARGGGPLPDGTVSPWPHGYLSGLHRLDAADCAALAAALDRDGDDIERRALAALLRDATGGVDLR